MASSNAVAIRSLALKPSDELLVLRSSWSDAVLGKSFGRGANGGTEVNACKAGKFFVPEAIPVDGIRALHAAWERLAQAGDAICVRGMLSGGLVPRGTPAGRSGSAKLACEHITRRTNEPPDGHLAGLALARHHWLFLDMDKIRNVLGLDPRTQPDEVLAFLLGLLPPAIHGAAVSWNWSSSMCVGLPRGEPPACLSAHLRIWLDTALGHDEVGVLLARLREHAWLRLQAMGAVRGASADNIIDRKVGEPQQPLYVAAPRFLDGVEDPFPGGLRRGLLEGRGYEAVSLPTLERELDAAGIARDGSSPFAPNAIRQASGPRGRAVREPAVRLPGPDLPSAAGGGADILPLLASQRLGKARERRCRSVDERLQASRGLFAARGPLEVVRLVRGRVALGATDTRWRAWHEAGGVPDSQRDMVLFLTGCLVAESMPAEQLTEAAVNAAILEIGRLIIAEDWIRREWLGNRNWSALVSRAVAAGRGETEMWQGALKDPRYRVGRTRLLRELRVLPEEVAWYGLLSLAADRDRLCAKRRAAGAKSRTEVQAMNQAKAAEAQHLMASGLSRRATARAVGMEEAQLRRQMASTASSKKTLEIHSKPHCSASVPPVSADSSSSSRETKKEGEGEETEVSKNQGFLPPSPSPAAVPPPWADLMERYEQIISAALTRGADGCVAVPGCPADADLTVHMAYEEALEAVADARRRAAARHHRRHGPATRVRAWYDGLAVLPPQEALACVRARRRELRFSQKAERKAATSSGWTQDMLALRHKGKWAAENRHAARALGPL